MADKDEVLRLGSASHPVQLFVQQDKAVPALISSGELVVYIHRDGGIKAQVGDVFWPLGSQTVCVRINASAFSFSIPECPGLYITAILPQGTPADELQALVDVLTASSDYHAEPHGGRATHAFAGQGTHALASQPPLEADDGLAGQRLEEQNRCAARAAHVGNIAEAFIRAAAQAASNGLARGAQYVTHHTAPAREPTHVSDATIRRLDKLRRAAGTAAAITGSVAHSISRMTVSTATGIAVAVQGSSISRSMSRQLEARGVDMSKVSETMVASVAALDQVLQALEDAGVQVVQSLGAATTHVVDHRYGPEAAAAAGMGVGAAVHVAEAQRNIAKLRPTRLIKKTAQHVAKHVATGGQHGHGRLGGHPPGGPVDMAPGGVLIEEIVDEPAVNGATGAAGSPPRPVAAVLYALPAPVPSANGAAATAPSVASAPPAAARPVAAPPAATPQYPPLRTTYYPAVPST